MARARKNGDEDDETARDDDEDSDDDSNEDDGGESENEEKTPRSVRGHRFEKQGRRSSRDSGRAAFKLLDLDVASPLSRSEAAKRLGVRPGTLAKWQHDERITGVQDEHGTWWFDPVAVEALRTEQQGEDFTSAQLLDAARGIIKQQFQHHEAMSRNMGNLMDQAAKREAGMMGALVSAMREFHESQSAWALRCIERAAKLEGDLDASHEAVENAKNQTQERELSKAAAEYEMAMKATREQEWIAMAKTYAPTLLAIATKKLGVETTPSADPLDASLRAAIGSLSVEQLQIIAATGALNQSQQIAVAQAWQALQGAKTPSDPQQVKGSGGQPDGGESPHPGPPEAKT